MKGRIKTYEGSWTREEVKQDSNNYYVFGDNTLDRLGGYVPTETQAVIRGLPNAIGIDTKTDRRKFSFSYLNDSYLKDEKYLNHLNTQFKLIEKALNEGHDVYVPVSNGQLAIGTGKAKLPEKAPQLYALLREKFNTLYKEYNNDIEKQNEENLESFNDEVD